MDEEGIASAGARQDREAAGGRAPRGDRRPRSTGSWWPAATWASSCPSKQVPLVQKRAIELARRDGQAGHRRHPDARLDDPRLPPDPGRGLRRGQRRARRRRRADALRRDQRRRRTRSTPSRTMGRDHRRGRGADAARQLPRRPGPPAHHRRRHRPRGRRGRRVPRRASSRRLHHVRATPPGGWPATARRSRCWRSPRSPPYRSQLALDLGRRDLPRARGVRTPTRWSVRSTRRCWRSAAARSATAVVIVAGSPPGIPGSTNALRVHRIGDAVAHHPGT